MRSRRAAAGARRGASPGGGRTRSTGAGYASSTRRARADQDLAIGLDGELALRFCASACRASRSRSIRSRAYRRAHRFLEAARMLEIRDRGAGEIHADRRGDQRAGERSVEDTAAEDRLTRELFVDVQRIEIAK